jgi:hypothetical protein
MAGHRLRTGVFDLVAPFDHRASVDQQWYDFEQAETKAALRDWCQGNQIEIGDL